MGDTGRPSNRGRDTSVQQILPRLFWVQALLSALGIQAVVGDALGLLGLQFQAAGWGALSALACLPGDSSLEGRKGWLTESQSSLLPPVSSPAAAYSAASEQKGRGLQPAGCPHR